MSTIYLTYVSFYVIILQFVEAPAQERYMALIEIMHLVKGIQDGKVAYFSVACAGAALAHLDEIRNRLLHRVDIASPVVGKPHVLGKTAMNFAALLVPPTAPPATVDGIVQSVADELGIMLVIAANATIAELIAAGGGRQIYQIVVDHDRLN